MKKNIQPLTKDLIRKHFGKDIKIYGLFGHYRIKTRQGYEVAISEKTITPLYGGSKLYRQMMLFAVDLWGQQIKVHGGSSQFKHAIATHAEFLNIDCQPDYRSKTATFARWFWALVILVGGEYLCATEPDIDFWFAPFLVPVFAFIVFRLMKSSAREDAQRRLRADGFEFPRADVGSETDYATDRDMRERGLL